MFVIAERASVCSEDIEDRKEGLSCKCLCGADLPIPSGLRHTCLVDNIVQARAIAECAEKQVLELYAELENLVVDDDTEYTGIVGRHCLIGQWLQLFVVRVPIIEPVG